DQLRVVASVIGWAFGTTRQWGDTKLATQSKSVDMQFVSDVRRDGGLNGVLSLIIEAGDLGEAEPRQDPAKVSVHGKAGPPEGIHSNAFCGPLPHTRETRQELLQRSSIHRI